MNKIKEEFDSVIGETAVTEVNKEVEFWKSVEDCFIGMSSAYDNAPLNIYKLIREFINKNYISKEQILNLECLKEENESGWKGNSFDNTGNGNKSVRNNLRKELIDEIKKL